jgi:hypothetical protein
MIDTLPWTDFANVALNAATFVAAAAAVVFTHRTVQIQRKQKLAEFRKEWVENLRNKLADFRAANSRKQNAQRNIDNFKKEKNLEQLNFWSSKFLDYHEEVARAHSYIKLCLNIEEEDHRALVEKIERMSEGETNDDPTTGFHLLAAKVLKAEWKKVKNEL